MSGAEQTDLLAAYYLHDEHELGQKTEPPYSAGFTGAPRTRPAGPLRVGARRSRGWRRWRGVAARVSGVRGPLAEAAASPAGTHRRRSDRVTEGRGRSDCRLRVTHPPAPVSA